MDVSICVDSMAFLNFRSSSACLRSVTSCPVAMKFRILPPSSNTGVIVISSSYGVPSLRRLVSSPCQTFPARIVFQRSM